MPQEINQVGNFRGRIIQYGLVEAKESEAIKVKFWPAFRPEPGGAFHADQAVVERARKYLAKVPVSVSGQGGHNAAFHAACVLVLGFGLPREAALTLLREWNQACRPPWSERELVHKVDEAIKQPGPRNYLRNVQPAQWSGVRIPDYAPTPPKPEPRQTTLAGAARAYLENLRSGKSEMLDLGIADLDYALGGGVERGELVLLAARPSHGKSAVALQCVHHWTEQGLRTLLVSEEMSALALGKRTLQFLTETPQEYWATSVEKLEGELEAYAKRRQECYLVESCRTAAVAVEQIDRAVEEHQIQAVVIDYAQLLGGRGRTRYEEITNTSIAIRQVTNKHHLLTLLLCQLNRGIEGRPRFVPVMSDLRDTGQLEQDADVIVFLAWPHRLDSTRNPREFVFFVGKNRNRPINQPVVTCRFLPSRQMVVPEQPRPEAESPQRFGEFDRFSGKEF